MDDFHIHSTYSDGLDSIEILINKTKKLTMFSITDHNNIEASKHIKKDNFTTGVELSTYFFRDEYHILGYNFDANNKKLNDMIKEYNYYNNEIFKAIYKRIANNIKIDPTLIDILIKQGINLNKVSITKIISKELNNQDLYNVYDNYVKKHCQNITYYYISIKDIIENIKTANGYLILAHPFISCKHMNTKTIIGKFLTHGGDGIEITPDSIDKSKEIIDYYNALYSIGSDYHSNIFNKNNILGINTEHFDNDKRYLKNIIRRK